MLGGLYFAGVKKISGKVYLGWLFIYLIIRGERMPELSEMVGRINLKKNISYCRG